MIELTTAADALLIQLPTKGRTAGAASLAGTEHLGLSYLASALEICALKGRIIDTETDELSTLSLSKIITECNPSLVGFSPTSATALEALNFSSAVKRVRPSVAVIWGGHLATAMGAQLFELTNDVDAVITGQGERLIAQLVTSARERKLPRNPSVLPNAASSFSLAANETAANGQSWLELFPSRQKDPEFYGCNGARMLTSMGCPFDCSFCTTPGFSKRQVVHRQAHHIEAEVRNLVSRLSVGRLWINDDLFCDGSSASQKRAIEFATVLQKVAPGMKFRAMLRSDLITRQPLFISELVRLGLDAVFVGIESGNSTDLLAFRKRLTIGTNASTASILKSLGVFLQIGFIMFSGDSSLDSILSNARFLESIGQLYRFFPLSRTVQIFPGTELWRNSTCWDSERSSPFLRFPAFKSPAVRTLSIAFGKLESIFAPSDHDAYSRRMRNEMPIEEMEERSRQLLLFVQLACRCASQGANVDDILQLGQVLANEIGAGISVVPDF